MREMLFRGQTRRYGEKVRMGDGKKLRMEQTPTIDAVEVVRCKDCRSLYDQPDDYCCTNHKGLVMITPNSFCSYGERRVDP